MAYIGSSPTSTAFVTDSFNGNASTTVFTMSVAPANPSSALVAISGVLQDPTTYAVSGTSLTFSSAPPLGTGNISVRYLGIPASGITTTAYRTLTEFTATAGQTTFSPPSYTVGYINVYRNGSRLGTADFTATNGTSVVLNNAAGVSDLVAIESFYITSVTNALPQTGGVINAPSGAVALQVQSNSAVGIYQDSSANVGIGTASPLQKLHVASAASAGNVYQLIDSSATTNGYNAATLYKNSDRMFRVGALGGVQGFTGGYFVIYDETAGAWRMVIDNSGRMLVGLNSANASGSNFQVSQGVTFPATQSASADANTLDDYEEGTWTPFWRPATTNFGSITYAADTGGRYTKIGRMVYVQFFIQVSAYSGGSGFLRLQGFPFNTDGVSNQNQGVTVHLAGSWGTNTINSLDLGGTSANAKYRTAANGTLDNGNLNVTDMATNCFVRACFCYQTST